MNAVKNLLVFAAGFGAIWWAGARQNGLVAQRETFNPVVIAQEGVPPWVIGVQVALGPFRGLMVDALWMRATRMQDEGKYFELVQLSETITRLEPRFPDIWAYHAWNMTYNISVLFNSHEDRWRWVRHGISLLRDKGIPNNPRDADLFWELGWFYQHKLGQDLDSAHFSYKLAWAREMSRVLGGPRPDYESFAKVPAKRNDLLKIEGLPELVAEIEQAGVDPWGGALLSPDQVPPELLPVLEKNPLTSVLVYHLRKRQLIDVYKLDLDTMQEVDREFGPFDWRLPQAHAVYWAFRGKPFAKDFKLLRLQRMIFQSMAASFNEGRLEVNELTGGVNLSANIDVYKNVNRAYYQALRDNPDETTIPTAHRNFLTDAIIKLFTFGRAKEAKALFSELREKYPGPDSESGFEGFLYAKTALMDKSALSREEATQIVEGYLYQSLYWLAIGESDRATGFERLGRLNYESYMAPRRKDPEWLERTGLPPIEQLHENAKQRIQQDLNPPPPAGERPKDNAGSVQ